MLKLISTCGLALAMTAGTLTLPASMAIAQDLELQISPDGIKPRIRDRDRDLDRDRDQDFDRQARGCDPEQARELARDAGLRRAKVVRVSERRIVVQGMSRSGPERMTFANRRGCPEI